MKNNYSGKRIPTIFNSYISQSCNNNTTCNGYMNNHYSTYSNNSNSNNNVNCSLQKSSSGISLFQGYIRQYNTGPISNQTPQPSPSISEYDEYPWFGTTPESPRVESE